MEENKNKNLNSQIKSGFVWNFLERGGIQIITFVVQLVLARLLTPEDYGIIAILSVFISLSSTFVNNGLGNAVIQKKDSDEKDFNTVFIFQLFTALFFVAVLFIASPWIAQYYNNDKLVVYLRVMSLTLIIDALYAMHFVRLKVQLQFKKRFYANIVGIIAQSVVGIGMALMGCGVWSLIVSQIAQKVAILLTLLLLVRWIPKLQFSFKRLKKLFSYSWKLFVGWLIGTLHHDIYAMVIGKFFTMETLGYYNRASNLPQTITKTVNETVSNVMFPALAKLQDNTEAFKQHTRKMMSLISFIIWPVVAGIAAVSESFIMVILTEKWAKSIEMMQLFAVSYGFNIVSTANMQSFNALGRSDIFMKLEMVKRTLSVLLLILAAVFIGNIYIVIGIIVLMGLFSVVYNSFVNVRLLNYCIKEQLSDMLPPVLLSVIMFVLVSLVNLLSIPYILKLVIQVVLGVIIYFLLATIFKLPAMNSVKDIIKSLIKKGR